jgi:DNA-binding NtrC family response regulator
MEKQLEILVIGTNPRILETVLRLLNTNTDWNASGVSNPDEALKKCRELNYQVFLIGAGLSDAEEAELSAQIKEIHPGIHIIPHYGGGSGLLFAEIYLALGSTNQAQ